MTVLRSGCGHRRRPGPEPTRTQPSRARTSSRWPTAWEATSAGRWRPRWRWTPCGPPSPTSRRWPACARPSIEANTAVWRQSQRPRDLRGMGTTLTAAALVARRRPGRGRPGQRGRLPGLRVLGRPDHPGHGRSQPGRGEGPPRRDDRGRGGGPPPPAHPDPGPGGGRRGRGRPVGAAPADRGPDPLVQRRADQRGGADQIADVLGTVADPATRPGPGEGGQRARGQRQHHAWWWSTCSSARAGATGRRR